MSLGAVIGFSLCAAALCVLLRQYRPEIALVISILCGMGVLLWLLEQLAPVLEQLQQLSNLALGSAGEAAQVLLKALGICLITQVACDTCRDIGETAIAARLETAGKAAMLLLSMPVFSELLQQALRLIGT